MKGLVVTEFWMDRVRRQKSLERVCNGIPASAWGGDLLLRGVQVDDVVECLKASFI